MLVSLSQPLEIRYSLSVCNHLPLCFCPPPNPNFLPACLVPSFSPSIYFFFFCLLLSAWYTSVSWLRFLPLCSVTMRTIFVHTVPLVFLHIAICKFRISIGHLVFEREDFSSQEPIAMGVVRTKPGALDTSIAYQSNFSTTLLSSSFLKIVNTF